MLRIAVFIQYDFKKVATLLNMTNHNSAANAVRSLRRKIECYYNPDGVPPSAASAPKKRGKAAKVVNGDDVDANEENSDAKATTKKKRAPKKKANETGVNGNGGNVGNGGSDDATTPTEESSATSTSPKRKHAGDENGSPKKKVCETKIKSEEIIKEEGVSSEGMYIFGRNNSKSGCYNQFYVQALFADVCAIDSTDECSAPRNVTSKDKKVNGETKTGEETQNRDCGDESEGKENAMTIKQEDKNAA